MNPAPAAGTRTCTTSRRPHAPHRRQRRSGPRTPDNPQRLRATAGRLPPTRPDAHRAPPRSPADRPRSQRQPCARARRGPRASALRPFAPRSFGPAGRATSSAARPARVARRRPRSPGGPRPPRAPPETAVPSRPARSPGLTAGSPQPPRWRRGEGPPSAAASSRVVVVLPLVPLTSATALPRASTPRSPGSSISPTLPPMTEPPPKRNRLDTELTHSAARAAKRARPGGVTFCSCPGRS